MPIPAWRWTLLWALLVAVPAAAQVTTFGADLTLPDNVSFDCSVWPVPLVGFVPTGATSCTWSFAFVPDLAHGQTTAPGLFVPAGNGTVTQVRVKVGATPGPMRIVVLQALR